MLGTNEFDERSILMMNDTVHLNSSLSDLRIL
jgi:hypothetical protein